VFESVEGGVVLFAADSNGGAVVAVAVAVAVAVGRVTIGPGSFICTGDGAGSAADHVELRLTGLRRSRTSTGAGRAIAPPTAVPRFSGAVADEAPAGVAL
jgi:hypothetical protein